MQFTDQIKLVIGGLLVSTSLCFARYGEWVHVGQKTKTLRPYSDEYVQKDPILSLSKTLPYFEFDDSTSIQFKPMSALTLIPTESIQTYSWEGGLGVEAGLPNFKVWVDSRIYTQPAMDYFDDGQFIDPNDEQYNNALQYNSYGRFIGLMGFQTGIGNWYVGREAQQWGPSKFSSLLFHQMSIPYDQIFWDIQIKDFHVRTLWANLDIREVSNENVLTDKFRHVFGHRYSWIPNANFEIAISEQLVVYDYFAPQMFLPFYPLFIAKSYIPEPRNNGNISIDLQWILFNKNRLYGEFFIDDIESPISFFSKNYIQNKWALNLGFEHVFTWFDETFLIGIDGVHTEPYIYGHFKEKSAQAMNGSMPIGLPEGSAFQRVLLNLDYTFGDWALALNPFAYRKGAEHGSSVLDLTPDNHRVAKEYFKGVDWKFSYLTEISYSYNTWYAFMKLEKLTESNFEFGIAWKL